MAIFAGSRFAGSQVIRDARGRRTLTDRRPYRYHPHSDNREHPVTQNDTLAVLAGHYFAPLPRACGFWWVLADYQPEPLVDPLTSLYPGRAVIIIPSIRVLTDIILVPSRAGR